MLHSQDTKGPAVRTNTHVRILVASLETDDDTSFTDTRGLSYTGIEYRYETPHKRSRHELAYLRIRLVISHALYEQALTTIHNGRRPPRSLI
jgi:hypothetical protein